MTEFDTTTDRIEQATNNGYTVEISNSISEAFDIFKKYPGGFIGFLLVTVVVSVVLGVIPIVGSIISLVISPALNIGTVIVAHKIKNGEQVAFGDFFLGFSKFGELFLGQLLMLLMIFAGFLCFILPGIYLAVAYAFVSLIIWFMFDGGYWSTLEKSRKLISKEWFSFFLFFIVILLLNMAGLLCLGVGVLVTAPVSSIALYVCFDKIVGTQSGQSFNISDHLTGSI